MQPLIHLCHRYRLGAPYPSAKDRPIVVRRSEWWAEMTPLIRPWMIYDGHGRCMLRDVVVGELSTLHLMMVHHPHPQYIAAAQWSGRCFVHCCANWVYSTVFNRYEIGRYNGVTCTQFEGGYVRLWAASLPSLHRRWILSWLCAYKNKWDSHKWTPNSENLNSYVEMRFYEELNPVWPNVFNLA